MYSKIKFIFFLFLIIFLFTPTTINAQVSINEYLPDSNQEWIEFYNSSASAEYIKNYYIDDDEDFLSDSGSSSKKPMTALNVSNPQFPYIETSSFLNNSGDFVVLFDQVGNLIDKHQFISNPGKDISIGRYLDGSGIFYTLSYPTKGDSNPAPPTPSSTPIVSSTNPPTTTPAQTVVPTSKPSPTKSPTSKSTQTPTPTPKSEEETDDLSFNLNSKSITAQPSVQVMGVSTKNNSKLVAIVFIGLGVLFLGYGGYLLYNVKTKNHEKNQGVEEEKLD